MELLDEIFCCIFVYVSKLKNIVPLYIHIPVAKLKLFPAF